MSFEYNKIKYSWSNKNEWKSEIILNNNSQFHCDYLPNENQCIYYFNLFILDNLRIINGEDEVEISFISSEILQKWFKLFEMCLKQT